MWKQLLIQLIWFIVDMLPHLLPDRKANLPRMKFNTPPIIKSPPPRRDFIK